MKILITFYYLNNLGGIINNQEGLVHGLQALGHDVKTRVLVWKSSIKTAKSARSLEQEKGTMGMSYDQELGWTWPAFMRIPYKGKYNIQRWKDYASQFDLIIWQIPVPTKQRNNAGNTDWVELYDLPVKQIIYTHDGNIKDYPWIYKIVDKLHGAVGVHPCAYHGLKDLPLPRAMAFSAQMNMGERIRKADQTRSKRSGWLSLQTFKGWKHVDDLVRAVPHMKNKEQKLLAGGGLHMYYMTSKDKMREVYLADVSRDPDMKPSWKGRPIWEIASEHGMEYYGYITNKKRDELLLTTKFLIDPSWSRGYASIGDHFNRTSIEALICGALPIARNLGVSTNEEGWGEFFTAGENYVMVPYNATPGAFADIVDDACAMSEKERKEMIARGREMLGYWEAEFSAQTFIDLAKNKPAGVYAEQGIVKGTLNDEMKSDSSRVFNEFFAGA